MDFPIIWAYFHFFRVYKDPLHGYGASIGISKCLYQTTKFPILKADTNVSYESTYFSKLCANNMLGLYKNLCSLVVSPYSGGKKLVSSLVERKDVSFIFTIFPKNFLNKWYLIWKPLYRVFRISKEIGRGNILRVATPPQLKKQEHLEISDMYVQKCKSFKI